jgi:hypothetical protein
MWSNEKLLEECRRHYEKCAAEGYHGLMEQALALLLEARTEELRDEMEELRNKLNETKTALAKARDISLVEPEQPSKKPLVPRGVPLD